MLTLPSSARFYHPQPPMPRNVTREKRELWGELNVFVQQRGASLTSVPNKWPARLECSSDARVLMELELATVVLYGRRFGFSVRRCTEEETGGPVLRIKPHRTIEIIEGPRSSSPPTRVLTHAGEVEVACFNITTRSL